MFDWKTNYKGNLDWLPERTVLLVKHGSHAYGLNTPTSDLDIKGVAIPPVEYFLGWLHRFEQAESKNPDMSIYDIRKFFLLATDCNPNIIEVLWGDEEDILQQNWVGQYLRHFRSHFLSQKAKYTFSGYAIAQLKRIKTHRKWLLNPPTHKPERSEYGLPDTSLLSADLMGAVESVVGDEYEKGLGQFGTNVMEVYQKERTYHNALTQWHQFQSWKKHRNPARAELEIKFGYDTKHAMHLVRLMRMCREILTQEKVIVKRPDREELLAIRAGAWSYDKLINWAENQDMINDGLLKTSKLRHRPDRVFLDGLCKCWLENYFGITHVLKI